MTPDDPQFDAKIAVLKEQVEHHIEEEEAELFPKVRRMFKADELEDLGVAMEDMAEDLKAEGAPRESVPAETGAAAPLEEAHGGIVDSDGVLVCPDGAFPRDPLLRVGRA